MLRAPVKNTLALSHWVELPIFPVSSGDNDVSDGSITVQTDGTLIQIRGGKTQATATTAAYIVDASRVHGRITEIDIVLDGPGSELILPVAVDGGSNLNAWQPLVKEHRLATLEFAGHRLSQTHVPLPKTRARYLRLRPLQNHAEFRLKSLRANVRTERNDGIKLERLTVSGATVDERLGEIHFDLGAYVPIHELRVDLIPNKLLEETIESRSRPTDKWRQRQRKVFYALERNGLLLRPNSMKIGGVQDRYWRLSRLQPKPTAPVTAEFVVGWRPAELVFLAEGLGPYVLAVGRADAQPVATNYSKSLAKIADRDLNGRARIGPSIALGGASKMTVTKVLPWRQILLWGLLVSGVSIVGLMVWRLLRQMKA